MANNQAAFFALVQPNLERLEHFVRHVIAYAESPGDLVSGELAPDDILDTTLLKAAEEFEKHPTREDIRSWLMRLVIRQLAAEIRNSKRIRDRTLRVEEDIPETPPAEEVTRLGEETLDFYQPDEDLKLEDVIPDFKTPTPERETETKELRHWVNAALQEMPREWRRAIMLRFAQELPVDTLAKTLGKSESEVTGMIDEARNYLREKLTAAGCTLNGAGDIVTPAEVAASLKEIVP